MNNAKSMLNSIDSSKISMIKNMLSGKGITPEQAVRSICKQNGIDVDEFMSMLK